MKKLLAVLLSLFIVAFNADSATMDSNAFRLGMIAYHHAKALDPSLKPIMTIVDFTKPSSEPRLYVINTDTGRILFESLVAHGAHSGDLYARLFSNKPGSLKSSIGCYITLNTYYGSHGRSLKIKGLEYTNSNAYTREIVVHGAWYVNYNFVRNYGEVGHSWGCFAVDERLSNRLIDLIQDHTFIFAYYPDQYWLSHSKFLN